MATSEGQSSAPPRPTASAGAHGSSAAEDLRARLRGALTPALKARDTVAVSALRSALAAIDNAEAVEVVAAPAAVDHPDFAGTVGLGSGEVARRLLTAGQVLDIVRAEIAEREAAARDYDQRGQADHAARLRAEAATLQGLLPRRVADMFLAAEDDPREGGPTLGDERATLVEFLRAQRLTLELKCAGLDAAELARRSVEPSTLSLLGLVRHMAEVERRWFRLRMAGQDAPPLFTSETEPDGDFDGALPDPEVVAQAWEAWRAQVAFSDRFVADAPDLDVTGDDPWSGPISLRELLVHMIEEYARHNGHADLLRERIDGRVGQ